MWAIFRTLRNWWRGDDLIAAMVREYKRDFPGRCLPCRYQLWGINNGLAKPDSRPQKHTCIEPHIFGENE